MTTRVLVAIAALTTVACSAQAVLTEQVEARRLASNLQVQFSKTTEASNRAVMSDADEDSRAAVREAEQATQAVLRDVAQLRTVLMSMGYSEELQLFDDLAGRETAGGGDPAVVLAGVDPHRVDFAAQRPHQLADDVE